MASLAKVLSSLPPRSRVPSSSCSLCSVPHRTVPVALQANRSSFYLARNMELLAAVYAGDRTYRRESEMEKLVDQMKKVSDTRLDVLLCQAYHAKLHKRLQLAAAYAHKVLLYDARNEEAQILMGALHAEQKQLKDAVAVLRPAVLVAPHRRGEAPLSFGPVSFSLAVLLISFPKRRERFRASPQV